MVELKAKVDNLTAIRDKLLRHGAEKAGIFHQIDTYYKVPKGRLKLREVEGKSNAQLIYYEREDIHKPKRSLDFILTIPQPRIFKQILNRAMEKRTIVEKTREIYCYKGVQIHLDVVKGLGTFVEFERVTSNEPEQQKKDLFRLEKLREQLGLRSEHLESLSYSDLI
ncbi:MAG: class IV adenylate cyclase [Candidatus Bathyarchaeia archaeon]